MSKLYTTFQQIRGIDKVKRTFKKNDMYIIGVIVMLCGVVMAIAPQFPSLWNISPDTVVLTAGQYSMILGLVVIGFGLFMFVQRYRFRHLSVYQ